MVFRLGSVSHTNIVGGPEISHGSALKHPRYMTVTDEVVIISSTFNCSLLQFFLKQLTKSNMQTKTQCCWSWLQSGTWLMFFILCTSWIAHTWSQVSQYHDTLSPICIALSFASMANCSWPPIHHNYEWKKLVLQSSCSLATGSQDHISPCLWSFGICMDSSEYSTAVFYPTVRQQHL